MRLCTFATTHHFVDIVSFPRTSDSILKRDRLFRYIQHQSNLYTRSVSPSIPLIFTPKPAAQRAGGPSS